MSNWPNYSIPAEDSFPRDMTCRFVLGDQPVPEFVAERHAWANTQTLERDAKDAGAMKVKPQVLRDNPAAYADILVETGLLDLVNKAAGTFVFPTHLMHIRGDAQTRPLLWHRDSYLHRGQRIGPRVPPLKLAVYLTDVDKDSGVTAIQPRLKHTDFNNRYIDTALAVLMAPFAQYNSLRAGEATLFSGGLMHARPKEKNGNYREVLIYSLSTMEDQLADVLDKDSSSLLREVFARHPDYEKLARNRVAATAPTV